MKKSSIFLIAGIVALSMQSCASVFCGSKAKVTFDCNVSEGVRLTIDGIKHHDVNFPFTTKVGLMVKKRPARGDKIT